LKGQGHLTVLIVLFVIGNTLYLCQGKQHSYSKFSSLDHCFFIVTKHCFETEKWKKYGKLCFSSVNSTFFEKNFGGEKNSPIF
jgi:hypothetical protein